MASDDVVVFVHCWRSETKEWHTRVASSFSAMSSAKSAETDN